MNLFWFASSLHNSDYKAEKGMHLIKIIPSFSSFFIMETFYINLILKEATVVTIILQTN